MQRRSKKLHNNFVQKMKEGVKELQEYIFGTTNKAHKANLETMDLRDIHKEQSHTDPAVLSLRPR